MSKTTIARLQQRIDEIAERFGMTRGRVHVVVCDASNAPAAVAARLALHPGDKGREVVVIATGVPRAGDAL